jgi:urease accessory protein UreF
MFMIATVSLIDWKQISVMAQDETKRFSLSRHGAARQKMIAKSCLKLPNLQLPSEAHRSLHLKHRSQQAHASLHCNGCGRTAIENLLALLPELNIAPALAIALGVRAATENISATLALTCFLQSYLANLVTAGVRPVPLGQTDGQLAIAELERAVLAASAQAEKSTMYDLGSAAFMVDLASASHESQYTRLFRS